MLINADFQIEHALKYFADHDLEVGLLSPTKTGLDKSIMDAHGDLRAFLQAAGVHDYDTQFRARKAKVSSRPPFSTTLKHQIRRFPCTAR